jgi:hypothetical protein
MKMRGSEVHLGSPEQEEDIDTYLYGAEFTSARKEEEQQRLKKLQQQQQHRIEEGKLELNSREQPISAAGKMWREEEGSRGIVMLVENYEIGLMDTCLDEDDIYGELGPKEDKFESGNQIPASSTTRKAGKEHAGSVEATGSDNGEKEGDLEVIDDEIEEEEDEEDVEIVLNMPTKEQLEAKRQQIMTAPGSIHPRTNKTYVKPGLESIRTEKLSSAAPITSTQDINLDKVGQIQDKDAYEFDVDSLEDKPWKKPGADLTDYFNYGFNEHTWKQYCQKQLSLRAEFGLKKRINVRGERRTSSS